MAILQTALAAIQRNGASRKFIPERKNITAELKWIDTHYVCTGLEAAGDVLEIVQLPIGAIPVPFESVISTDGTGGTGFAVASIGDALSANRYSATSIALSSAASTRVTVANAVAVTPYAVDDTTKVLTATLALTSGATTAGKIVRFWMGYRVP